MVQSRSRAPTAIPMPTAARPKKAAYRQNLVDLIDSPLAVAFRKRPHVAPVVREEAWVVLCQEDAQASCCAKDEGSDPSKSPCRRRLQTAIICCESKARWW